MGKRTKKIVFEIAAIFILLAMIIFMTPVVEYYLKQPLEIRIAFFSTTLLIIACGSMLIVVSRKKKK